MIAHMFERDVIMDRLGVDCRSVPIEKERDAVAGKQQGDVERIPIDRPARDESVTRTAADCSAAVRPV